MHLQLSGLDKYRHVVFTDPSGSTARIVNLAPKVRLEPADGHGKAALTDEEQQFVRSLFACAGLDAGSYRSESIRRRLHAALRALRATSILEARWALARTSSLVHVAIDAMVIGVSSFFRDAAVFDQVAASVIPSLSVLQRPARIWSVGCSDGQELYSVAMLLAEQNLLDGCYLLGTDCRIDAIQRARDGIFAKSALLSVPVPWVEKYFTREDENRWQIAGGLRAAVQWRTADATRIPEPGAWDLILCRNMAMYLRSEVSGNLWRSLEAVLKPGGFLALGKAERPAGAVRLSPFGPCIYRRDKG